MRAPAVGILNAVIVCAATYGLLVGVALTGGRNVLFMGLLLLLGLLQAGLTGLARRPENQRESTLNRGVWATTR